MWLRFDVEVDQHGHMVSSLEELHETGGVDRSGLGVVQRVKVQVERLPSLRREVPAVVMPHHTENTKISTPIAWTARPRP